jgi:hypothetical protein
MLQLKVHAEVLNPTDDTRATTNDFHFTFDSMKEDLPSVIPKTYAGMNVQNLQCRLKHLNIIHLLYLL